MSHISSIYYIVSKHKFSFLKIFLTSVIVVEADEGGHVLHLVEGHAGFLDGHIKARSHTPANSNIPKKAYTFFKLDVFNWDALCSIDETRALRLVLSTIILIVSWDNKDLKMAR